MRGFNATPELQQLPRYRLECVQEQLFASECDAALLIDPINIRYATGARKFRQPHALQVAWQDRVVH